MAIKKAWNWWRNVSIFTKLYGVVGVMALLIAVELFSMLFTMDILSAVRSFVGGEGSWSKAQKDSIQSLHKYAFTSDRKYYLEFQEHLRIPYGDRQARLEMQKEHFNIQTVRDGFIQGQIHPNDIDGLVRLFRRFHFISYMSEAIQIWSEADSLLDELITAAADLDKAIAAAPAGNAYAAPEVNRALEKVDRLNSRLTVLENRFSSVLGEGSRWLEGMLKYLLIFAVLIVESTGLFLTFSFSRHLSRSIQEMSLVAQKVGTGDFSTSVPVQSEDELGQLAKTINRMTRDLESSIGQRQKAENENQIKSLFLANMSHEIRTPLGIILGLTEALKQPDIAPAEQKKFIETIERTGQDLRQIVNDILDISKVEAGYLDVERSQFKLTDFLNDLSEALNARAIKNDNTLSFRAASENIPPDIYTDRVRLRQILTNLLSNALKFTKNGSVEMTYWYERHRLYFRIVDTGIGMTAIQAKQLFQPFSQLDSSMNRRFGGTGLGLFLSRRLASLLGGDIVLERSEPNKGSTFLVTIESHAQQGEFKPSETIEKSTSVDDVDHFRGKRVLIVDDSADNQLLLQFFLKKWNVTFDAAENGQIGVEMACAKEYDLILMDIQMPQMDGYEATKELRRRNIKTPIIALTAHAMKYDQERCLEVGCNLYLTKPVDFRQLYATLKNHF